MDNFMLEITTKNNLRLYEITLFLKDTTKNKTNYINFYLSRLYEDKYKTTQGGKVGITMNCDWTEPRNTHKQQDHVARDNLLDFFLGWWAKPIFVDGDYPNIMKVFGKLHRKYYFVMLLYIVLNVSFIYKLRHV